MPERNMKIKSDYEKFRLKFKDPESKFNEKELLLIEKEYLFDDYKKKPVSCSLETIAEGI
jgi:hypothetical protein